MKSRILAATCTLGITCKQNGCFCISAKLELDIEEYSFSQTTLEQVFLKFSHYDEANGGE